MPRTILILVLWVFCTTADAILVTMERLREMTPSEIRDATSAIHARYPSAKIELKTTAWFVGADELPQAYVRFESALSRVNIRFCQSTHGELKGSLISEGTAQWERLRERDVFRVLHEQPGNMSCVSDENGRKIRADEDVNLDTVAWMLDHESMIWSQYIALAMRRYGADFGLPNVSAKLHSAAMSGKDSLELGFSGDGHISYHARLQWVVDRWTVAEAFIVMP